MAPFASIDLANILLNRETDPTVRPPLGPHQEWSLGIRDLCIALLVLNTIFVAVRLLTRAVILKAFGFDDGFFMLAWAILTATISCTLRIIHLEWDVSNKSVSKKDELFKLFFALEVVGTWTYLFLKLSFFLSYLRIFGPQPVMRKLIWVGIAICTVFYVGIDLAAIFKCQPLAAAWDSSINGHCSTGALPGVGISIFNVVTDLYILILPLPMVLKLQTSTKRKAKLFTVFALGVFIVVCSITRLAETARRDVDPLSAQLGLVNVWVNLETSVGLWVASALVFPAFWDRTLREPMTRYWSQVSSAYQSMLSSRSSGRLQSETSLSQSTIGLQKVQSSNQKGGFVSETRQI